VLTVILTIMTIKGWSVDSANSYCDNNGDVCM
jgi:hypothetical protein